MKQRSKESIDDVSDKVLTLEEAAKFLKVAPEAIADLLESGELPGRQIAGKWRTTKRAVISFVDGVPLQPMVCCTPTTCCPDAEQTADGTACCTPTSGDGSCC